jgi:hypothetical protein
VPVFRWDRLWPGTPELAGDAGVVWARHVVQLGCHQQIGGAQLAWIAEVVRKCVQGGAG